MQRRVGVGGLVDAVGVAGAVGGAVGEDEDAVGGDFFEEDVEGERVEAAAALAPDEDGEAEGGGGRGWGVDYVVWGGWVLVPGGGEGACSCLGSVSGTCSVLRIQVVWWC